MQPFGVYFDTILAAFWTIVGPPGTILGQILKSWPQILKSWPHILKPGPQILTSWLACWPFCVRHGFSRRYQTVSLAFWNPILCQNGAGKGVNVVMLSDMKI